MNKTRVSLLLLCFMVLLGYQAFAAAAPQDPSQKEGSAAAANAGQDKGTAFKAEKGTVSGTLSMVDSDKNFVSVKDSNGTSFGFKVSHSTKVTVGGQKAKLADLSSNTNKQATVKYMARRDGDVAQSIEVSP